MSYNSVSTPQRATAAAFTGAPPGSLSNGYRLYLWLYRENNEAVVPDTGWTEIAAMNTTTCSGRLFKKTSTGTEPGSYNFTWTTPCFYEGYVLSVSGVTGAGDEIDVNDSSPVVETPSFNSPALSGTLASGDTVEIYFSSNEQTNAAADTFNKDGVADPTWTVLVGSVAGVNTSIAYKNSPSSGASGDLTFELGNNDTARSVGAFIAVKATVGGSGDLSVGAGALGEPVVGGSTF